MLQATRSATAFAEYPAERRRLLRIPSQASVVKARRYSVVVLGLMAAFTLPLKAQTNPVPLINQPLVPAAMPPGGPGFTLTVEGTGFVTGSVVNWNGSARATTFVTNLQLKAAITTSDIAVAGTASVTVFNPAPGGGVSNVEFFQITNSTASVSLGRSDFPAGGPVTGTVAADFNGDGKVDLAFVQGGGSTLSVVLGNGDGTFQAPVTYTTGSDETQLATGDFNGDGKPDLVTTDGGDNTVSVLLGNGDGTFQSRAVYNTGLLPVAVATADFNGDGKLDLAVVNGADNTVSILLGNGDGTFQPQIVYATGNSPQSVFAGDFNADDKLDLAVGNIGDNTVSILLGNGDGTFQAHVDYPVASFAQWIAGAGLKGDGKLDLIIASFNASTVSVLLGNGDGTFQPFTSYTTGGTTGALATGDFNGDGKIDFATSNGSSGSFAGSGSVSIFLGNGDGTFQPRIDFATGASQSVVVGDFNRDGKLDLAIDNGTNSTFSILLQAPILSGTSLTFSGQLVGTSSASQNVTLGNNGSAALTISNIAIAGTNGGDFSETNTCPASPATLAAGANCLITVTFQPTATGSRSASVTITEAASNSPQSVLLTGVGTDFSLSAATGSNCPSGGNCSTSAKVTGGQTATYNLQAAPFSGFNGTVTLVCTGAPANSTCTVSPTSVTVNGTAAAAFSVTVTTTASSRQAPFSIPAAWRPVTQLVLYPQLLFALALLLASLMTAARHPRRGLVPVFALLIVSLFWITGCGAGAGSGGRGNSGTTFATVTITGTSSGVNHSAALSLTVN
jgi:hypothetical protein